MVKWVSMNFILYVLFIALITLFVVEMNHSLKRSAAANYIVRRFTADEIDADTAIAEVFAYCQNDRKLKPLIEKYGATQETFAANFAKLRVWGDIKKGRRYVPLTSFFYVYSLEWLLKNPDADEKTAAMKMMNFLHI